ncbi:fibroblast growth factor receptor substrate 2 [Manduca sexta]|uniref:IRS-type PTB domain-containing protein n=1 Tax=Manduca sexta TaxID=7130 RepID=A0A922A0W6_MANSE|nr:fibroblast growth factor receptor substrate 2 [Manduca sexta]KAG6465482.1 hypothetical protein O3G_MSEX015179 [Manduca sexta]
MGCLHSKKESTDVLHPNVFRVVNIDENGSDLCSGQLEITESDIILYREGRDSTVWPLHSLRRYGFEGEIFSFESGRRCETGEGIYAFKCRRASLLFRTLQQQIQLRNVVHESVSYPMSRLTPSPQGRQTVQASVVHRSSIDNSQADSVRAANIASQTNILRNSTQSPRSPSSADILEVMPLNPRTNNSSNHVTNLYQFRDFKREHNNNQSETMTNTGHEYCNDLSRDLAVLRHSLRQETALNTLKDIEDENRYLENKKRNKRLSSGQIMNPLSPTLSNEHYAQLSIEQQEAARLYMNIAPNEISLSQVSKNDTIPTTPLTPKQVEYCNLSLGIKPELNTYANLSLGELGDSVKNIKQALSLSAHSDYNPKFSESDTFTSMSPVEELEVNYAVLDIDSNKEIAAMTKEVISSENNNSHSSNKTESLASGSTQSRTRLVSQNGTDKTPAVNIPAATPLATIGYTTIDFDKTVALTSVASGTDVDVEGPRKTRHNSCNMPCGSPASEKSKSNYG